MPERVPRAPRLPLRAPISFRSTSGKWTEGQTLNISRSGVLFTLPAVTDIREELELVINLSRGAMQGPGVAMLPDLHCRARVVRLVPAPDGQLVVAVSIRRQVVRRTHKQSGDRVN